MNLGFKKMWWNGIFFGHHRPKQPLKNMRNLWFFFEVWLFLAQPRGTLGFCVPAVMTIVSCINPVMQSKYDRVWFSMFLCLHCTTHACFWCSFCSTTQNGEIYRKWCVCGLSTWEVPIVPRFTNGDSTSQQEIVVNFNTGCDNMLWYFKCSVELYYVFRHVPIV